MRIGIAFDLAPADRSGDGPDDRYEEFDRPETVLAIAEVIRDEGHEAVLLGDGRELLAKVLADPPDFVWNMAEGEGVGRCREARVPAVLEMLGIPYSGSDPLTMSVSLDKDVAKRIVASYGVATPGGVVLDPHLTCQEAASRMTALGDRFGYPLIAKPAFEGSSKGIRSRCLIRSESEGLDVFRELARDYAQQILVEEFICGDEITVGLMDCDGDSLSRLDGEADVEMIGMMRITPKSPSDHFVYSLEVKRDWSRQVDYETPGRFPEDVARRLRTSALASYQALGCRTVARIDFRLRDGLPIFLEANPLPGLTPGVSDLVILAEGYGIHHRELIRRILRSALVRNGLATAGP